MNVCLINPPQILNRSLGLPDIFQPLGLLYIAACLEKKYCVSIIDTPSEGLQSIKKIKGQYYLGLTFEEIEKRIRGLEPDVVGITVPFTVNLESAIQVASMVKLIDKKIITILGGIHPTACPAETLAFGCVDFVVIGEGEDTIQELLRAFINYSNENLRNIPGIGFKYKNDIVLNSPRDSIKNVDLLPFPARHLLPMENYFTAMKTGLAQRKNYIYNNRWATIITSRGCPYNCNFCSIHGVMGRKFRPRSPESVVDEIKHVVQEYDIRHINFEDDNLTLDKKRAERIFDLMIENKIDVTWSAPNGIRADAIDENLVRKMKLSGCKRVFVAPESGEMRVLADIIGKNLDLKKVEESIKLFRKYKIIVDGSFVIGFIGETKKDIWKTIRYAIKLEKMGLDGVGFHIATPYYGTRLYEEAKLKGFLREDISVNLFTTAEPLIKTPDWSLNDIRRLHKIAIVLVKINYRFTKKIAYVLSIFVAVISRFFRRVFIVRTFCISRF